MKQSPLLPVPGSPALRLTTWLSAVLFLGAAASLLAMPPGELQQRLDRGDKLTVIDVRSSELYAKGHIPGAINIPASVVPAKKLPALGDVVVYGEGLGRDATEAAQALAELNRKPGIKASLLDGGFSSWESAQRTTTARSGLKREELTFITYDQLKRSEEKLVLVDLREQSRNLKEKTLSGRTESLTDLRRVFPRFTIIKDPSAPAAKASGGVEPVLVLIDRNDGTSEDTARKLRSQGRKRVIVLAGGEEIIAREGRPGLDRVGPGIGIDPNQAGRSGATK